jgi:hypothetical protein
MIPIDIQKDKLHIWVDRITEYEDTQKIDRFEVIKCTKELMRTKFH